MSARARIYLWLVVCMSTALGAFNALLPEFWTSPSYGAMKLLAPLWVWGLAHLAVALVAGWAALSGEEVPARVALVIAALVIGALAFALLAEFVIGTPGGPVPAVLALFVTGVHLVMCRMPLRTPFEPLVQEVLEQQRRESE